MARTLEDQIIRLLHLGSNIVRAERQTVRPLAVIIGEGLFCRERLAGAERRMGIRQYLAARPHLLASEVKYGARCLLAPRRRYRLLASRRSSLERQLEA